MATELNHSGAKKLNTSSTGVKVTGDLEVTAPVFGGLATSDVVAHGGAYTATDAIMLVPINSTTTPASITVVSTFNVTDLAGGTITGGGTITPLLHATSSQKIMVLTTGGGLTTTIDKNLMLRQATATSKITVNL